MDILPAIDLIDGKCVRLLQGQYDKKITYGDNPAEQAKSFIAQAAKWVHVIDLDGAFSGVIQNLSLIEQIKKEVNIPIAVGGGIRDMKTIKMVLKKGIDCVVLGTIAIYNPELVKKSLKNYKEKIIVAIDALKGNVAIGGWKDVTSVKAKELGKKMELLGVRKLLFTDIHKDGMLSGPNLKAIRELAQSINIPVIASGGISTFKDVEDIKKLEPYGVEGMIIGRALYTEAIKLPDAIRVAQE